MGASKKPVLGLFSFTCCQGCEFTVLFVEGITKILEQFDVEYFHLIKQKNRDVEFDLAFVEGAITTKKEIEKLKEIRSKSKYVVALGACACHGGIPAMKNFIENSELQKYVYNQHMLDDSIEAQPIENFIDVNYRMYGCPIDKNEFVRFVDNYLKGLENKEFDGPVCAQCPRRGKNCFLKEKKSCLGALTHGGCDAICVRQNIPCIMCRGPLPTANIPAEIKLFESWGLEEKDVLGKILKFGERKYKSISKSSDEPVKK